MKRTRHTPEQVIRKLREADRMGGGIAGAGAEHCRRLAPAPPGQGLRFGVVSG